MAVQVQRIKLKNKIYCNNTDQGNIEELAHWSDREADSQGSTLVRRKRGMCLG